MEKSKIKKLKWAVLIVTLSVFGVVGLWVGINFSALWKNLTFDKNENITAYDRTKAQEGDRQTSDRLEIPALNVVADLFYPGNTWDLYRGFGDGVGHMPDTAMPGETGNAVFFGHSSGRTSTYYATIFATLHRLEIGDEIYIYKEDAKIVYKVESKKIVGSNDFSILEQGDTKQLSLITCWPLGTDWQRYVITALQVNEATGPV
jgi:LPXTG-site transpeptidase (sortase) family protein